MAGGFGGRSPATCGGFGTGLNPVAETNSIQVLLRLVIVCFVCRRPFWSFVTTRFIIRAVMVGPAAISAPPPFLTVFQRRVL